MRLRAHFSLARPDKGGVALVSACPQRVVFQQHSLVGGFPDDALGFGGAFSALIARVQARAEFAQIVDAMLQNRFANLVVGDFLADTDVHHSELELNPIQS
jgi:hypothetical protein